MLITDADTLLAIIKMPPSPRMEPVEGLPGVFMKMSSHSFNKECITLTIMGKGDEADRKIISRYCVKEDGTRFFTSDDDPRVTNMQAGWGWKLLAAYNKANEADEAYLDKLEKNSEADPI